MFYFLSGQKGNAMVGVAVAGALAVTALVGVAQLAANYSQQQAKARKASGLLTKKEMALEFLRSKFIPREMANGSSGTEWNIRNVSNKVEVSFQTNYCYEFNATTRICSAKSDPLKAPIRDVYRRWQIVDGTNVCALVTPYQEYSGAADPQMLCAPHYDEYEKDGSQLASVQTKATLQGDEQQKAYITVSDLAILSSSEQDQLLSGSADSQLVQKSLVPLRVAFSSYVQKNAPDPDEITVVFDDGEQGQILVPKPVQPSDPCGTFTVCTESAANCMARADSGLQMSGGTSSDVGTDKVLTFNSSGTLNVTKGGKALVLLVGGGGGGNTGWNCILNGSYGGTGGGGGGETLFGIYQFCSGSNNVVVGQGGMGGGVTIGGFAHCPISTMGAEGSPSSIGMLKARGGLSPGYSSNGGNSGGGVPSGTGGWKHHIPGYRGGPSVICFNGGGGGGAAGRGESWSNTGIDGGGGNGGSGSPFDIRGAQEWFAGGGGGGGFEFAGNGGLGGGGSGYSASAASPGTPNSGGGGGGGRIRSCGAVNVNTYPGASGGSGIVIIRYK